MLYLWLEHNRFRRSWEIDLMELKALLRCTADTYKQFYRFNDLVLKKCQKEIIEKTNCRFTYEPLKRGRTVRAVRFTVETQKCLELDQEYPNRYTIENELEQDKRDKICLGFANDIFNEFTDEQLEALKEIAWSKVPLDDIERHKVTVSMPDALYWALTDYLSRKIKIAKTRKPKNLFLYVKTMVEKDKDRNL